MFLLKTFKYRLYPTPEQALLIDRHISASRLIYNLALETKSYAYSKYGVTLSCKDLSKQMTELKKECIWLNDVNSQSLQHALRKLDNAFTSFFNHQTKYPKFKSKKKSVWSCHFPQNNKIDFSQNLIKVAKFTDGIKIVVDRKFGGDIKTVCITKTKTNKYFASVNVETAKTTPIRKEINQRTAIGIDLGIKHYITLSDGRKIDNPKFFIASQQKLKIQQQRLARKNKDSNRYNQQKLKISKCYEKILNQRLDFQHKLTTEIINQYDTICLENLNISGMMKNHRLAKHIQDASWHKFIQLLEYKAKWSGKNILKIGRFEPSSRMCTCGLINHILALDDREWTCKGCGVKHDRDITAAINIKRFALLAAGKLTGRGTAVENMELPTMVGAMKSLNKTMQ